MRFIIVLCSFFTLVACETTVNAPGPASPELEPLIQTIVANANAEKGERISSELIGRGATSEGNTITFLYEAGQELTDIFRDLPRGQVDAYLRTLFRQDFCSDPEPRAFILAGGRVALRFVDNIGRELSRFTVSGC